GRGGLNLGAELGFQADVGDQPVVYGAAEVDAEDLRLALIGASVNTRGLGLGFGAGVSAYVLSFDAGASDGEQTAVAPQALVRWQAPTWAVQAGVGYIFIEGDEGVVGGAPGGGEDGVLTSLQGNYWGTDNRTLAQAIASYNVGGEYLWTNARASRRVADFGRGGLNLGAELGFQADVGDQPVAGGSGYEALQAGVVAEYQVNPSLRFTGVVGGKSTNVDAQEDLFPYAKLEFVLVPGL
ncbi:MAG TPA: hypothetical protein VHG91_14295, partial [Longimicrobium sp.]|nr:hypothetical protein [Longimicrobium sp.]